MHSTNTVVLYSLLGPGPRLQFERFKQRQAPASLATKADGNLAQKRYCLLSKLF